MYPWVVRWKSGGQSRGPRSGRPPQESDARRCWRLAEDWTCTVVCSESGVDGLVRLRGKRRWRRFAGRIGDSSVAFRGSSPDPATAIQAVTGSGLDAVQEGGVTRSKDTFSNVSGQLRQAGASPARTPGKGRKWRLVAPIGDNDCCTPVDQCLTRCVVSVTRLRRQGASL